MIFRNPAIRTTALCLAITCLTFTSKNAEAQDPAPAPPQTAAAAAPASTQPAKKSTEPDYPDARTLSVGLFYWLTVSGPGPDVQGGRVATGYSSLFDLGKYKPSPILDVRFPITRTGELRFEGFLAKGDGSQKAPLDTTLFGTSFNKGDALATQYQITGAKLYLDDLLYPYRFPVSKFRLKSLWAIRYLRAKTTIDAPLSTAGSSTTASSNRQVILPEFGIAAEYAVSPHVLLRVDGAGFGLPHRSLVWDSAATASYRRGQWSAEGGFKVLGFKTSPYKDEYVSGLLQGAYVGIRYNWK